MAHQKKKYSLLWVLLFCLLLCEEIRTPRGQRAYKKRLIIVFSEAGAQSGTEMRSIWVDKQGIRVADASPMAHQKAQKQSLQKRSSRSFEWVFIAHDKASLLQGVVSTKLTYKTKAAEFVLFEFSQAKRQKSLSNF